VRISRKDPPPEAFGDEISDGDESGETDLSAIRTCR
jgi:hypothetical protein